jgi:superkiller protein 3
MFENNQRIVGFIRLTTIGFFFFGLILSEGCLKGFSGRSPNMYRTWTCDEEADNAMRRQDYESGILLHQQLLEKEPGNGLALYHLGYAFGQRGDHLKEVFYYERAVNLGFQDSRIFFNLGMAYGELNQPEQSIRAFKKALDIDPDSADNHFGLGLAYQGSFNDKQAEEEFLKAISIDPGHQDARLHLAMLYTDGGYLQKAADQLRKLFEFDPSHEEARKFLERIESE